MKGMIFPFLGERKPLDPSTDLSPVQEPVKSWRLQGDLSMMSTETVKENSLSSSPRQTFENFKTFELSFL